MELTTVFLLIAIVAVIACVVGYIAGSAIAHNSYDSYHLIVEKSADLPDLEVNRIFKDQLELLLIREGLVETVRDEDSVIKSLIIYAKTNYDGEE